MLLGEDDRRRRRRLPQGVDERDDLVVARIGLEHAPVPVLGSRGVPARLGDVAEMAQGDEVLGIERERGLEDRLRLVGARRLEQGLPVHDMPAQVPRLLLEVHAAQIDGRVEVARLAILVGERREEPARVLLVAFLQLVNARRGCHLSGVRGRGAEVGAGGGVVERGGSVV